MADSRISTVNTCQQIEILKTFRSMIFLLYSYYNVPTLSIEVPRNQTSMFNTALEVVRRAGEMLKPDVETSNTKRPKKVPDKWQ